MTQASSIPSCLRHTVCLTYSDCLLSQYRLDSKRVSKKSDFKTQGSQATKLKPIRISLNPLAKGRNSWIFLYQSPKLARCMTKRITGYRCHYKDPWQRVSVLCVEDLPYPAPNTLLHSSQRRKEDFNFGNQLRHRLSCERTFSVVTSGRFRIRNVIRFLTPKWPKSKLRNNWINHSFSFDTVVNCNINMVRTL